MVWSVLGGGSSSGGSSSMVYSTAVQYFENLQVTKFTLDLNTGVLTMTLKEGKLALPDPSSVSTVQSTGGLLSGMLSSSSSGSTGAEKNSDGTVTVRYKLPYASMFVKNVDSYIAAYDEANPDARWSMIIPRSRRASPGWRSCSIWLCWAAPASCSSP